MEVSLLWECTMRRRMKWRYVSMPCCSDSYTRHARDCNERDVWMRPKRVSLTERIST